MDGAREGYSLRSVRNAAEEQRLDSTRTRKLTAPAVILLLSASLSAQAPQKTTSHPAAKTHKVSHHGGKKSRKPRGQQAIDGERARQIQAALIREHYMSGEPSGKWDDSTQRAMRRYQADQGWQSKSIPDSRALIRMGLGPDHGHLLNPESAMVSEPRLSGGTRAVTPVAARRSVPAQTSTPVTAPAATVPDISPTR
jgi:peptidoglycan hydrolase-like protein with peptidoglycan-binding domain